MGSTGSKQCRSVWAGQDQSSVDMYRIKAVLTCGGQTGSKQCRHVGARQDQSSVDMGGLDRIKAA